MPGNLATGETVYGGSLDTAAGAVSVFITSPPGNPPAFTVVNYGYGDAQAYTTSGGAAAAAGTPVQLTQGRIMIDLPGGSYSLSSQVINLALAAWDAGDASGHLSFLSVTAHHDFAANILAARIDGQDLLFVAASDGAGVSVFAIGPDNTLTILDNVADSTDSYLAQVSDLAVVQAGDAVFLFAGSATENGLSGYQLDSSGTLTPVSDLGMEDSLPVNTITALDTATIGGQAYLVVASAGSSSLTVLAVGADGSLTPTDHIIDGLETRFDTVDQLEIVQSGDLTYVIAAGGDAGLSIFALTPDGDLVHLETLADTVDAVLDGVSSLAVAATATGIEIYTTANGEAGLGHLTYDTSGAGLAVTPASGTATGSDLDDILLDGDGAELFDGGEGADVFIMRPDGEIDTITNLRPGEDRIDLTGFPMFRSIEQLDITITATGARISYQGEELILETADGTPLTIAEIKTMVTPDITRIEVNPADLETSEPDPDLTSNPDPDPDPTPDPDPDPDPDPQPDPYTGTDASDQIFGSAANDTINGAGGGDRLDGNSGNDRIYGGSGSDEIFGRDGDDRVFGESGNDAITGNDGDDYLEGGSGDDMVAGADGNDISRGGTGNDDMGGGQGNDLMFGGDGDDRMGGGDDDDTLYGDAGNDFVAGGAGNDTLFGGTEDDRLNGGSGNDTLTGGDGADMFVFNDFVPGETDRITDFELGLDTIRLAGIDGADPFSTLQITNVTGGVEVAYGGHVIMLDGISADDLDAGDFLFI